MVHTDTDTHRNTQTLRQKGWVQSYSATENPEIGGRVV